jgi:hypothetical protein
MEYPDPDEPDSVDDLGISNVDSTEDEPDLVDDLGISN